MIHQHNASDPINNSRILIVDDNPQNLQVLGKLLQEQKYEIEFATNGRGAIEWLENREFDLVLLDINMPEMDGFEVCQRIRSEERLSNVPVIFLSADSDRESILKGFELGAQDYVTKPFDSRELIVRVKTHLSLKESLEKIERANKYLEEKVDERTSQLKSANEKLELLNQKLLELDSAKSEFLHMISHEIRTPLNGIKGPIELLKKPSQYTSVKDLFEILDSSLKRLENFSANALLITGLKIKPHDIVMEDVYYEYLIGDILYELNANIEKKQLTLHRISEGSPAKFTGDVKLIKKCLYNIIDNAIVYNKQNGQLSICSRTEDNEIVISVGDRGKGIPEKILNSNSDVFSRGSAYRDNAAGIGLPLAKLIMQSHNGSIDLKNMSEGACVTLRFRLERPVIV